MSGLAPQWALNAQGIDAAGDPHLALGIHLRVFVSPELGLPIAPFRVVKQNLGPAGVNGQPRNDGIVWTDSTKKVLTLPIKVIPGNAVTAWLPTPGQGSCYWIEIDAEPGTRNPTTGAPGNPLALRCDANVAGLVGPVTVSSALKQRYQMSASRIDHVVITGDGTIKGASWLDAERIGGISANAPWRLWSLPVAGASRYSNVADYATQADLRVKRGAPPRKALYDDPKATTAAVAAAIVGQPGPEVARIGALATKPKLWAQSLISSPQPPHLIVDEIAFFADQNKKQPGTMQVGVLSSLLQSAMDPGMARFLGLADVDTTPGGNAGDVIVYLIRGIWQYSVMPVKNPDYLDSIPGAGKTSSLAPNLPPGIAAPPVAAGSNNWWVDVYALAAVTVGKATASPSPPVVTEVASAGWLPDKPDVARREVLVTAKNLAGAAGVAFVRKQGTLTVLNPKSGPEPGAYTLPLVASILPEAGSGRFVDRSINEAAADYRLAQVDWFGRWSDWTEAPVASGKRPLPPPPVIEMTYTPPKYTPATIDNWLAGDLEIRSSVPRPDGLAPAAHLIATLEISVNGAITTVAVPNTASPPAFLAATVKGPGLPRAGKAAVEVSAKWIDTAGFKSGSSQPIKRTLRDARPPTTLNVLGDLFYTNRPDDTGKASLELQWQSAAGHKRYRVYSTDEPTLNAWLASNNPALLAQLKPLQKYGKAQERGTLYAANKALFPRDLFELMTSTPIEAPAVNATMKHRIVVSGSLGVLTLVRIVAVSESNVDADFAASPLLPYAIPNTPAPAQPMLEAIPHPDQPGNVKVRLRAPRGVGKALAWRLRRSSAGGAVPMQMPIVQNGLMPLAQGDVQQVEIVDSNEAAPAGVPTKLLYWNTYYWTAEVRGGDEPGSSPPIPTGWSAPSAPVSLTLIPPDPPDPVKNVTAQQTATPGEWKIGCEAATRLRGGAAGRYQLDLYRKLPNDRERYVKSVFADAPPAAGGQDAQNRMSVVDFNPAGGAHYRLVLVDPIGRASAPSDTVRTPISF